LQGQAAFARWVQGERQSPVRGQTAQRLMERQGSMPATFHGLGDATGARSGPLAKMAVSHTAHLANSDFSQPRATALNEQPAAVSLNIRIFKILI